MCPIWVSGITTWHQLLGAPPLDNLVTKVSRVRLSLASAATALFVSFGLLATPALPAAGGDNRGSSAKGSTTQSTASGQATSGNAMNTPAPTPTSPPAPELAETSPAHMAGTWVWAEYPKTDGTPMDLELRDGSTGGYYSAFAPERVVAFAVDKQLDQISLWVPQDIASALAKGQRPKTRAYLTNMLTQAHAAGLQVLALTDSYHWLNTTGAPNASSFLSRPDLAAQWIADIAKTGLPFDGVRLDVETGAARAWVETSPGTTKTIAELYLEFAQLTSLAANLHGLPLTLDVDAALGELHVAAGSVAHLLVGALNPTTDTISVMAYRDSAIGIHHLAQPFLTAAGTSGLPVQVAVETMPTRYLGPLGGPSWTFHDDGAAALAQVLAEVAPQLSATGVFAGFDVHHYQEWAALAPVGKPVGNPAPDLGLTGAPLEDSVIFPLGSVWDFYHQAQAPYANPAPNYSQWSQGVAPLGIGGDEDGYSSNGLATVIPQRNQGFVTYFHKTFALPLDTDFSGGVTLNFRADDAARVQVNGASVYSENVEANSINAAVIGSIATAGRDLVAVIIPADLLREGTNTITADVHTNWTTGTYYAGMSWDAELLLNESTRPVPVPEPEPLPEPELVTMFGLGSTWHYYHQAKAPFNAAPPTKLNQWSEGNAPIGIGGEEDGYSSAGLATVIKNFSGFVTYFQKEFELPTGLDLENGLTLTFRADDAVQIQVNGVPIYSENVEANLINSSVIISGKAAGNELRTVIVPGSVLGFGANLITADIHINWSTGKYYSGMSWDAELTYFGIVE